MKPTLNYTLGADGLYHTTVMVSQFGVNYRRRLSAKTPQKLQAKIQKFNEQIRTARCSMPHEKLLDLLERFYASEVQTHEMLPDTVRNARKAITVWRFSPFANTSICEVHAWEIQDWYKKQLSEQCYSPGALRQAHVYMSRAVAWGRMRGETPRLEVPAPPRPSSKSRRAECWDMHEGKRFFEAARGSRHELVFKTLAHTGLRIGELLGLQWGDVDFATGTLFVRRQLYGGAGEGGAYNLKTEYSVRNLKLPLELVADLETLQRRHPFGNSLNGYIFVSKTGRNLARTTVFRELKRLAALADVRPLNVHSLRHFHASMLFATGASILTVARRLGHSNANITLRVYANYIRENDLAEAEKALAALKSEEPV